MDEISCCFIGHREIEETDELIRCITEIIEKLISRGVKRFIFGSRSQFDSLCHQIVSDLRKKYPDIIRISYETLHECAILEEKREELEKSYQELLKKNTTLQVMKKYANRI